MKKIIFVCTENTCRSPMAAGIFNMLAERMGLDMRAESCGTWAAPGAAAADNAVKAAGELGADISGHASKRAGAELLAGFDRIYCMRRRHARDVMTLSPGLSNKISVLSPEVPDPYGGDLAVYRDCAGVLLAAAKKIADGEME